MKVNTNANVPTTPVYSKEEVAANREPRKKISTEAENKEPERKLSDEEKVQEFVNKANKELAASNTKLQFRIYRSETSINNRVSIKVIDETSERVIAEIPSEESIEFAEKMHELAGVLFDQKK